MRIIQFFFIQINLKRYYLVIKIDKFNFSHIDKKKIDIILILIGEYENLACK